jgi:hypothetical protein
MNETSTSLMNPVKKIAALIREKYLDVLILVDAVSTRSRHGRCEASPRRLKAIQWAGSDDQQRRDQVPAPGCGEVSDLL